MPCAILHLPLVANLWPNCSGRCERNNTIDTEAVKARQMKNYWKAECDKVAFTRDGLAVEFSPVNKGSQSVVECILAFVERQKCQLCVMGSVELMKMDQKIVLGSVAQAVAQRSRSHCCIVKSYGQEELVGAPF